MGNVRSLIGAGHPLYQGGKTRDANGYVILSSKEHGSNHGRREHRVVMERMISRPLLSSEVVHHINGDKADNRPENLNVETRASHMRAHGSGRDLACVKCGKHRWYQPAQIARLRNDYMCRTCRFGKDWISRKGSSK